MSINLFKEDEDKERNSAEKMDVDQPDDAVHMPAPGGIGRETERGEAEMVPPGPVSAKKKRGTRPRSGSASSGSSQGSGTSTATRTEERDRRAAAREAIRQAEMRDEERQMGEEQTPFNVESEDSEDGYRSSTSRGEDEQLLKRKIAEDEENCGGLPKTRKKQGWAQTTGPHGGRAAALEEANRMAKETAEPETGRAVKNLTTEQLFRKVEKDLEETLEEFEHAPTADVANQVRTSMAEVLRIARTSRNLQGGYVKKLKQAAVVGTASAEVLRTRLDCPGDAESDIRRQIRALKSELEGVRREAQTAKAEAETLRKELEEERVKRGRGSGRRTIIIDDSPPSSPMGVTAERTAGKNRDSADPPSGRGNYPIGNGMTLQGPPSGEDGPYDDERRKKEILPPPEEWPVALRPALRGKVKILEDRPLAGRGVRLAVGRRRGSERKKRPTTTQANTVGEGKGEAHALMVQLAPLLERWLRDNLSRLGIRGADEGRTAPAPATGPRKIKGGRKTGTPNPPLPPNALGTRGVKRGKGATTAPNMELWNTATDTDRKSVV